MAHVGQVEPALLVYAAGVFQASKPRVEKRRQCIWTRTGVFGTEIEVVTMPFGVDVNNIVPPKSRFRNFKIVPSPLTGEG